MGGGHLSISCSLPPMDSMGHSSVANGATGAVASMVTLMYDPVTATTARGGGFREGRGGVQPPFIECGGRNGLMFNPSVSRDDQ